MPWFIWMSTSSAATIDLLPDPNVRSQRLDTFFIDSHNFKRPFTEFGGWKGAARIVFLPTGETVSLILATNLKADIDGPSPEGSSPWFISPCRTRGCGYCPRLYLLGLKIWDQPTGVIGSDAGTGHYCCKFHGCKRKGDEILPFKEFLQAGGGQGYRRLSSPEGRG